MTRPLNPCWHETPRGMRYSRRGAGKPVIFLHGWCLNSSLWAYAEERFASSHDVIVPDLAGFGSSGGMAGPYDIDRYGEDLADLIEHASLRDATVVGFAFGAAVALSGAARAGERVAKVISVGMPDPDASPYGKMARSMRRDWPDFARRSAEALLLKARSDATVAWIERMFASAPLCVAIEVCGLLRKLDVPALAAAVAARQVYVHSTKDVVAPVAFGEACVAAAPDAGLRVIEGSGHLIVIDDKDAFHDIVAAELGIVPGTTG